MAVDHRQWFRTKAKDNVSTGSSATTSQTRPPPFSRRIKSVVDEAITRTRKRWLKHRPRDEQLIVDCGKCQENLRDLSWDTFPTRDFGYVQPRYQTCPHHPDRLRNWVADLTQSINHLLQRSDQFHVSG